MTLFPYGRAETGDGVDTTTMLGTLAVLALIDSTSFGTLGVPVWMLVQRRIRVLAVLVYLCVISGFYWVMGLALLGGADALRDLLDDLAGNRGFLRAQLVVGVGLVLGSFLLGGKPAARRRARRGGVPGRHERWKQRVVGEKATLGGVAVVALLAGLVEAASMLPYLGAVALLSGSELADGPRVAVLAGYVVLMAVPALVLLGGRLCGARVLEPWLARIERWMDRGSGEVLGWVVGIVGFLVAASAWQSLTTA